MVSNMSLIDIMMSMEPSNSITVSMVPCSLKTWNETGVLFDEHNGKRKVMRTMAIIIKYEQQA